MYDEVKSTIFFKETPCHYATFSFSIVTQSGNSGYNEIQIE
ncbi:hypothetical protein E6C60_0912 [Paenibacillus algicola]|uniref:Uncharacterized protein n=1 Tax=Paenibacillus algicola TaxID=2565926 RepID=A0A4P8XGN4_9BACL|nr:hypothetical protein E6C60_0912 [Paenibacillus algicola]